MEQRHGNAMMIDQNCDEDGARIMLWWCCDCRMERYRNDIVVLWGKVKWRTIVSQHRFILPLYMYYRHCTIAPCRYHHRMIASVFHRSLTRIGYMFLPHWPYPEFIYLRFDLCHLNLNLYKPTDFCNYRDGIYPCYPQLPTLKTVSAPEKDKIKGLPTCFPTNCACRKTER